MELNEKINMERNRKMLGFTEGFKFSSTLQKLLPENIVIKQDAVNHCARVIYTEGNVELFTIKKVDEEKDHLISVYISLPSIKLKDVRTMYDVQLDDIVEGRKTALWYKELNTDGLLRTTIKKEGSFSYRIPFKSYNPEQFAIRCDKLARTLAIRASIMVNMDLKFLNAQNKILQILRSCAI